MPDDRRARLIARLGVPEANILPCDRNCAHYGEGCALGHPLYSVLNGFGMSNVDIDSIPAATLERLRDLYSDEFRERWKQRLGPRVPDGTLPCSHTGCTFLHCWHD